MIEAADLQGHWRRDWIKAPGFEDNTTRVHWMQAGARFVDLRVPLARPDLQGRSCLADLSQAEILSLMSFEGFAGRIGVQDSKCTWHRQINWHGRPEGADIGYMFMKDNALMEEGVLSEYMERWLSEPVSGLRGADIKAGAQTGVMIENETVFMIGLGGEPLAGSKQLMDDLEQGRAQPEAISDHFASIYAMGRWRGDEGVAGLSSDPFCEDRVILKRSGTSIVLSLPRFDGATVDQDLHLT